MGRAEDVLRDFSKRLDQALHFPLSMHGLTLFLHSHSGRIHYYRIMEKLDEVMFRLSAFNRGTADFLYFRLECKRSDGEDDELPSFVPFCDGVQAYVAKYFPHIHPTWKREVSRETFLLECGITYNRNDVLEYCHLVICLLCLYTHALGHGLADGDVRFGGVIPAATPDLASMLPTEGSPGYQKMCRTVCSLQLRHAMHDMLDGDARLRALRPAAVASVGSMTANTPASTQKYRFSWSFSGSQAKGRCELFAPAEAWPSERVQERFTAIQREFSSMGFSRTAYRDMRFGCEFDFSARDMERFTEIACRFVLRTFDPGANSIPVTADIVYAPRRSLPVLRLTFQNGMDASRKVTCRKLGTARWTCLPLLSVERDAASFTCDYSLHSLPVKFNTRATYRVRIGGVDAISDGMERTIAFGQRYLHGARFSYESGGINIDILPEPCVCRFNIDAGNKRLVIRGSITTGGIEGLTLDRLYFARHDNLNWEGEVASTPGVFREAISPDGAEMVEEPCIDFEANFPLEQAEYSRTVFPDAIPLYCQLSVNGKAYIIRVRNATDKGYNSYKYFPFVDPGKEHPFHLVPEFQPGDLMTIRVVPKRDAVHYGFRREGQRLVLFTESKQVKAEPVDNWRNFVIANSGERVFLERDPTGSKGDSTATFRSKLEVPRNGLIKNCPLFTTVPFLDKEFVMKGAMRKKKRQTFRFGDRSISLKPSGATTILFEENIPITHFTGVVQGLAFNVLKTLVYAYKRIKRFKFRDSWLIGEEDSTLARDNGYHLFKWCCDNNVPEPVYYVIKRDSPDLPNLANYMDRVIYKDSLKHWFHYCLNKRAIGAHSVVDTRPSILEWKGVANNRSVAILNHGVLAMKKTGYRPALYNNRLDKFYINSNYMRDLLAPWWRARPGALRVTGLPRFDSLADTCPGQERRIIFAMFTWRDWLITSGVDMAVSHFASSVASLLENEKLSRYLEKHNAEMVIQVHWYFRDIFQHMEIGTDRDSRIRFADEKDGNIQELLCKASVLITDYSSVAFDFDYLRKNVLFYRPDLDDYLDLRGTYLDIENQLYGLSSTTQEELIDDLEFVSRKNFSYLPQSEISSRDIFRYRDRNNCLRVYRDLGGKKK